MVVPTLSEICLDCAAKNIRGLSGSLSVLSLDVGEILLRKVWLHDVEMLRAFAWAFWRPVNLTFRPELWLQSTSLRHLQLFSASLVRLDLSGCKWANDLQGLQGLTSLECLNLRNCVNLEEASLQYIQQLPNLVCLDLENVRTLTDRHASHYIPGMPNLRAVNLSSTAIGRSTVEALTYGLRLKKWRLHEKAALEATREEQRVNNSLPYWERDPSAGRKRKFIPDVTPAQLHADYPEDSHIPWPRSKLVFLRIQNTDVPEECLESLTVLQDLQLIDVRNTKIAIKKLHSLISRFRLTKMPNEPRMLTKSNGVMASVMKGLCGCSCLGWEGGFFEVGKAAMAVDKTKPLWVRNWEKKGTFELLQEATKDDDKGAAKIGR